MFLFAVFPWWTKRKSPRWKCGPYVPTLASDVGSALPYRRCACVWSKGSTANNTWPGVPKDCQDNADFVSVQHYRPEENFGLMATPVLRSQAA